jgi:asparagine synthase (glutamine-hydrolysing)
MCAITGKVTSGERIDLRLVVAMRDAMAHRGPDDAGLWSNPAGTVALGHRRLSIIDLSSNGRQPMQNEDGSVRLVFNGEIYNFRSLRGQLLAAQHVFRSQSDSEVIVHAYEQWGLSCVERLRGMFAFALWDAKRGRLVLARDRFGIKPLVYCHGEDRLVFASELKALLVDPRVPRTIDETAIYDFFTYRYVPTPKTIYQSIRKLPPAHYAVLENGRLSIEQYWEPRFSAHGPANEEDAVALIRSKLSEAVDLHMISDVPVGIMLSGGLDSSTLAVMATRSSRTQLHTFSIGFDVAQHDETRFARAVAARCATAHHEQVLTRSMAAALEAKVLALYDEPFGDSSAMPTFAVSKLARQEVKVALSGEGGDELFGGYGWYALGWKMRGVERIPLPLRRLAALPLRRMPKGFKGKWTMEAAALGPVERYARFISAFSRNDKRAFMSPRFHRRFEGYDDYWYFRSFWRDDLDAYSRMQYLDIKTYLHDDILTKVDRASMAVSLEARVPLLDHELMEAVFSLPAALRNPHGLQKFLFRKVVKHDLPAEILERGKRGFSVPLYEWLKDPVTIDLTRLCERKFVSSQGFASAKLSGSDLWPFIAMGRWLDVHG